MNEPIFSSCIVSRPFRSTAWFQRLPSFAVATTAYLIGGAGILLAPLFILEMDASPKATIAPPPGTPIVFRPPGGGRKGDEGTAPRIRRGGGMPDRPGAPPVDRRSRRQARPETTHQPAAVLLAAPVSNQPSDRHEVRRTPSGDETVPRGPGDPDGDGASPDGTPHGCPGCVGDGTGGGGAPLDDPLGRYDESDARITTQATLLPGTRALPIYPDLARRVGVQGSVILLVVIGVDGRVGAIEVLRSPDARFGFDLAAIEAVKQWRYRPALMSGRPVAVQMRVVIEFALAR